MKETNQLKASTSTKTQRCKKMDLLQEQEITTAIKEAWLKIKALELIKVTN
jgi:hypothetical protein